MAQGAKKTWHVILTEKASEMLASEKAQGVRRRIVEGIHDLANNPQEQGQPLLEPLSGQRSLVGPGFRIVYRLEGGRVVVLAVGVGVRKERDRRDIHALAKKLVRQRLT